MPTTARRWPMPSVSGCPIRQASKNSAAHPTASAISTSRSRPSAAVSETSQNAKLVPEQADHQRSQRTIITSANQIRSAIRPTDGCRRPAGPSRAARASSAIRPCARRKRTRRGTVAGGDRGDWRSCDPGEETGGIGMPLCRWNGEGWPVRQYHQSHASHPAATRRWAGFNRQRVRPRSIAPALVASRCDAPDLGLASSVGALGRLRHQPRAAACRAVPRRRWRRATKYAERGRQRPGGPARSRAGSRLDPISIDGGEPRPVDAVANRCAECRRRPPVTRSAISSIAAVTAGPPLCRAAAGPRSNCPSAWVTIPRRRAMLPGKAARWSQSIACRS